MKVIDKPKYQLYRQNLTTQSRLKNFIVEILLPCLLFGSLGAITWAIRGTSGWGGFDGAILPGFTWAILWYYFCYKRGIDVRSTVFWLGLGIAIGGMLGYGQYVSWIQGKFFVNGIDDTRDINPIIGYIWFWICGAAWGGIGGVLLGWILNKEVSTKTWLLRIIIPLVFALIGAMLVILLPQLFFPNYGQINYVKSSCNDCIRTYKTNLTNMIALMWWIGALVVAIIEKDKNTILCAGILGIGFGFAFAISAMWTLGYAFAPGVIDWWKVWEINMGFFGGILLAIVLYLVLKDFDKLYDINGDLLRPISTEEQKDSTNESSFFPKPHQRASVNLTFSFTILLLIIFYGMTYKLGVNMGLFSTEQVEQYGFPIERVLLLLPLVIVLLLWFIHEYLELIKVLKEDELQVFIIPKIELKLNIFICFIAFVGFITIWPSVIWIIYIFFFIIGLIALFLLEKLNPT